MHHIIYQSNANWVLTDEEVVGLLEQSRLDNGRRNITGALVYGNKQFIQLIEGQQDIIEALYDRIRHDPRHTDVLKLADKPVRERSFAEWSMAFSVASPTWLSQLAGVTSFDWIEQQMPINSPVDTLLLNMIRDMILLPT